MRIERISDTQMKFVLMTDDLEERDIKISELSYASDQTQRLFREIMTLVQGEREFVEGEAPLMFEAMRVGVDSLVVVVTKINGTHESNSFNLIPAARQDCRFKKSTIIKQPPVSNEDSYSVFSFENIDILSAGASRLPLHFQGLSQVHKMNNRYFLLLSNETEDTQTTAELEAVLYEYGQKHVSNIISRQYLLEHGEPIITDDAVGKLRGYFNM
jgi:adapter protein MecA 1/2